MYEVLTVTCNPAIDQMVEVNALVPGEVNRGEHARLDPGGKGINVARVLSGWGVPVLATGWLGTVNGDYVMKALDRMGVAHRFVPIQAVTRVNLKIVERGRQRVTEVNAPGFRVGDEEVASFLEWLDPLLDNIKALVLSGSLPPGAPSDLYRRCMELARRKQVQVFLDCEGEPFQHAVEAVPFAVKPNRRELEAFAGQPLRTETDLLTAGKALLEKGIEWVVVSDGANGAWFMFRDFVIRTIPPQIEAKSPVGAGDSMMAALVWGWLKDEPVEEVARMATAAGTVTATREGTGLCGWDEPLEMYRYIRMKRMELPV
jgi:1-phosphofructokinase